jgi:hypothetical protein
MEEKRGPNKGLVPESPRILRRVDFPTFASPNRPILTEGNSLKEIEGEEEERLEREERGRDREGELSVVDGVSEPVEFGEERVECEKECDSGLDIEEIYETIGGI